MASSHTSYGRLIMLFASLDASCLWFTQIHTQFFYVSTLASFIFACWRLFLMLLFFLLLFFSSSSHTEECAGNKRKKNLYLNVENRDYYEENVWQFFFLSLRFFCVFTQAIIVKINENDGKYEEKYTCMKHYFYP